MNTWKKSLAVGIILLFIGTAIIQSTAQNVEKSSSVSRGHWLYVGGNGPGNYSRIQDAVDNASDGDTVFVYDDSSPYYETIKINKPLNLIGENRDTTIIDGRTKDWNIEIEAENVTISDFTIQNASRSGIIVRGGRHSTITNNIIQNNLAEGILFMKSTDSVINRNIIQNNGGIGIRFFGDFIYNNDIICTQNIVEKNKIGIYVTIWEKARLTISENEIADSSETGIILYLSMFKVYSSTVTKNNFERNNQSANIIFRSGYGMGPFSEYICLFITKILSKSLLIINNYWGRIRFLPYKIDVKIILVPDVNWMPELYYDYWKVDWHPAKKPYDIPGMR